MMNFKFAVFAVFVTISLNINAQNMTNESLEKILYVLSDSIQGKAGQWQFKINNRVFICITDQNHNRMRIISPIISQDKLAYSELIRVLSANFHTVLDVKYALSDEILWSVFIHPLKELSKNQVISAVEQVYAATATYGTTYTSTNLVFPSVKSEKASTVRKQ